MDDLAVALAWLADAFPDDLEPAADSFEGDSYEIHELFDSVIYFSHRPRGENEAGFARRMLSLTPQLLRLYLGQEPAFGWDLLPDRLVLAGWREWPHRQCAAVEEVLRAWWHATLTEHPSTHPVDEVLMFVTKMTGDVLPWLATWTAVGGTAAARQFRELMATNIRWNTDLADFYQDATEDAIDRWLLRDGIDILSALPPGAELDAGVEELVEWEGRLWVLWWPADQLTTPRTRPFR